MKGFKTNLTVFSIGAVSYGLIEVLWRGFTHWSMLIAGGFSLVGLSFIATKFKRVGYIAKAFLGGALLTFIEFVFGLIFNIILRKNVWDYSRMPFNLFGQICAVYSAYWVALSFLAMPVVNILNKKLKK